MPGAAPVFPRPAFVPQAAMLSVSIAISISRPTEESRLCLKTPKENRTAENIPMAARGEREIRLAECVVPVATASEIVEFPLLLSVISGGVETHCVLIGTPSELAFGDPAQEIFKIPPYPC